MTPVTAPAPLTLSCHPRTPSVATRGVEVAVCRGTSGILRLAFTLEGDLSGLRIPKPRPSRRINGLWRHTCCEVFVMAGEGPGYREFHLSPSGAWAVYAFRGYREGGAEEVELDPGIEVHRSGKCLELSAGIRPELLPSGQPLRLGLSVVMEDADGTLSYWALRHPAARPDFHHTDAFALRLAQA